MTRLNDFLVSVNIDPGGALAVAIALAVLTGLAGAWMLWRAKRLMRTVSQMDERLASLSNSLSLLTDTTEACFRAVSMQMQFMQSQQVQEQTRRAAAAAAEGVEPSPARARQRRVVNAARRGEAMSAIAAREELSESEVALRMHMTGGHVADDIGRYGSLHS